MYALPSDNFGEAVQRPRGDTLAYATDKSEASVTFFNGEEISLLTGRDKTLPTTKIWN